MNSQSDGPSGPRRPRTQGESSSLAWALRSVADGPQGPEIGAFFDLDGTLVEGFTAIAFLKDELLNGRLGANQLAEIFQKSREIKNDPQAGLEAIIRAAEILEGRSATELEQRSRRLFRDAIARSIRPDARKLIRAHRDAGHTLVLSTAATSLQAQPVAEDLGLAHVISSQVEVQNGRLTGRLVGLPPWGQEKARAVVSFADAHGIDLQRSFAYGNGAEDLDFLHTVGHPVAVRPDPGLAKVAAQEGIPVLDLSPPAEPGLRGLVGTLGALSAFNVGVVSTVLRAQFQADKKDFGDSLGLVADLALKAAGVTVRAQGLEHVEAARPAVMIFNHQSNLDPVILGTLIRRDVTGVGKAELKRDPRAALLQLLDIALIDRSDPERAKASVSALVARVQGGESVAMAPEGTRMPTPRLGQFKMGAFHLAMDAGVPILPIVIGNSYELFPRGTYLIRPGTVDVVILPPQPTTDWTRDTIKDRAEEIRGKYLDTLENWPL